MSRPEEPTEIQIQNLLDPATYAQVVSVATLRGCRPSEVLEQAVREYVTDFVDAFDRRRSA